MRRQRLLLTLSAVLSATLWAYACGDGTTEPRPYFPEPTSVTVSPATAELTALGATVQLSAEVRDQNGQAMAGATVTWVSSATAAATVSASGLVTAVANGNATITATAGSVSGSAVVSVAQEVSTVTVVPDTATVVEGDTLRLAATATDSNGQVVSGAEFEWASGNTAVAVVDTTGLVTGVGTGEVQVTATATGVTGRAELAVVAPLPTTIAVTPDTVVLTALGQTAQLTAQVLDQGGRVMDGVPVTWLSAETTVATVNGSGLVTAVGNGAVTVTATAGEASGQAHVTVAIDLDRAALVALYEATDGPNWVDNTNWLTDAPLGEWYGVSTDREGRVSALNLAGRPRPMLATELVDTHGLAGPIPPELGDLANLEYLDLSQNDLSGPILPELGGLANLEYLDLGYNDLSGPIPSELGGLANLEYLILWWNDLSSSIPPELGNLANLKYLNFVWNDLSGSIPPELGDLANLWYLNLNVNELSGPIPPELGGLANLRYLGLNKSDLSGPIPPELGSLANLRTLALESNRLSGPLPPELGGLANLDYLGLAGNRFTGTMPREFLDLRNLTELGCAGGHGFCVPGDASFVEWGKTIGRVDDWPWCNESDMAVLESFHGATGGPEWRNSAGWLGGRALAEWHGVATDSLGRVTALDLEGNGLAGALPGDLASLTEMTQLRIGDNEALSGRLPRSLTRLSLDVLHYAGTDLCVPADDSFREWLDGIPSHEGKGVECPPLSDRDVLGQLYRATDGPNWADSDNWLTDRSLGEWHGVEVDDSGRVVGIRFADNSLAGSIPPELADLANLEELDLRGNELAGPIPPELGNLANLEHLNLGSNDLSGPIPSELGDLANLEHLNLSSNDLSGPIPSELGDLANLEHLNLSSNDLSGPIPPELGDLAQLRYLYLRGTGLSGPIPPELGDLTNLRSLALTWNEFSGPMPPQLGNLANLVWLSLRSNDLSGPIPPELGDLARLRHLDLWENELSGPIPRELGNLSNLDWLGLSGNDLSGPIPPELGNLTNLWSLHVTGNDLSGPVPPGFGGLSILRELQLAHNSGLEGSLPSSLTALASLEAFQTGGTGLCAPRDPGFQTWLQGVPDRFIAGCGDPPAAFLTQAVQSRKFPVPLVAGERALLRVFPTARRETDAGIPPVRARFYRNGRETHRVDIPGKSTPVPIEVDEGTLAKSLNTEIPGWVVRPGLEMVIEIDPDSTLDPELGVASRIPEEGRLAVEVGGMPLLDLTLVPFVWTETRDSSIVDLVDAMQDYGKDHELFGAMHLLPVGGMGVTAHEPVLTSSNWASDLFRETRTIRALEGGTGHYMGMMTRPVYGTAGVATIAGRSSFAIPDASTIAHELGHNLSLAHAPCGRAPRPDPSFPYPDGSIGAWGYDFRDGGRLVRPSKKDLMSYCGPVWISDYAFTKALRFRLSDADHVASPAKSLLLWGGVDADSVPFLEPAFVVDAPPLLPESGGEYRLAGQTTDGAELFSLTFAMPVTADGDGSSSFAFALPVRAAWEGSLATITLSGPDGTVTLDGDSDMPMAILRDPRTGQVRGFLRDPSAVTRVAADAVGQGVGSGLDVLFSRGIPDGDAWRR